MMFVLIICPFLVWGMCGVVLKTEHVTEAVCWEAAKQYTDLNKKPEYIYCRPKHDGELMTPKKT